MRHGQSFSFLRGYTFTFEDEGREIAAWFSAFSGLEKVYVNDELVARQRSYAYDSSSRFEIEGDVYETRFRAESILRGPYLCTLIKNGNDYKCQKLVFPTAKRNKRFSQHLIELVPYVVLGAIFAVFEIYFDLPEWSLYLFVGIVFIFAMWRSLAEGKVPVIEDEPIA